MPFLLEVSINEEKTTLAGFQEGFHVLTAMIDVMNGPAVGESVAINVSGKRRDASERLKWLSENLKIGDEIQIKVLKDGLISEPKEIKKL
ncbi:hypothetical protein [Chitinophaga barathri]|uniref:Uncharacterized protein n=1 Tax=Chitinophaga barathri TaxID=1647451 RepID=A0A3N4M7P6_9BACT|nr:hypothetical protein [Chitinophaga barathri]RPD39482.1 hypothetical protein EG028_20405 [Chitinophaga barathri]